MSENMAKTKINYSDLIKEVYIDAIRTVIVIDDEFPSLDGLIARELDNTQSWAWEEDDVKKVKEILAFCRDVDKPWLVDVHDGKKVAVGQDEKIAPYLHHSDLVILDYHLDGDEADGEKAINILRKLAANDHFNMVVVYTKGYQQPGSDIDRVVREISLGLSTPDPSFELREDTAKALRDGISKWEIEDEDILSKLKSEVTEQTYLTVRSTCGSDCKKARKLPEYESILELFKARPKNVKVNLKDLLQWLLSQKENEIKEQFSSIPLGAVAVSSFGKSVNWVRTDNLFITVVGKENQPQEIPKKLLQALNKWRPRPHRLLMAKMRSLIDERGAVAEAEVLSNKFIQTGWLLNLLGTQDKDKMGTITNTINRHWEALGDALTGEIGKFGRKLIDYLSDQSQNKIVKIHSPLPINAENKNKISLHMNCYVSTKPIEGFHLITGHVLEIKNIDGKIKHGVCLSPACDLVPGQEPVGCGGRGDHMPFTTVFLSDITDKKALERVYQNIILFLNMNGDIRTFTFNPEGDVKSKPKWEQMFAENKGEFTNSTKELSITRVCRISQRLKLQPTSARVVGQLRYEYALNLLHRLGVSLTRVGLDFKNISE